MIKDIFQKIEERLKARAYFSGWDFFRSDSDASTGKQNKAKVPFLRLVFQSESSGVALENRIVITHKTCVFKLDATKNGQNTDKDDLSRVLTLQEITNNVEDAILLVSGGQFLDLNYISNIRILSEFSEIEAPAVIENIAISFKIEVEYYRRPQA